MRQNIYEESDKIFSMNYEKLCEIGFMFIFRFYYSLEI